MRRILFLSPFILIAALLGCSKDELRDSGLRLVEIKTATSTNQSFEYSNGLLTKVNSHFSMCSTPVDESVYIYQNGRLEKVEMTMRSLYSSIATMCNPASGIKSTETLVYDNQGRLTRTNRQNSYSEYSYNSKGQVERESLFLSNGTLSASATYTYDSRGNITEYTDYQGGVMRYEYDAKINPFYAMKQKPSYISAFTSSPNNVIKGTATSGISTSFVRNILEYENDLPVKILENGVTYTYIYQ